MKVAHAETMQNLSALSVYNDMKVQVLMLKVQHSNYYQRFMQNFHFQPKVLLLAQPLFCPQGALQYLPNLTF